MGDSMNLDKLKTQYRVRFYRDRYQDLPELRPGSNVLSAIKDYFHDTSGEESPGLSRSSFFADSVANINIPGSIQKKEDSSINPCISKLNRPYSTGEINKTEMKATTSSAVNEILKTPPHFKNFDNVVSEEEVDDCESDMPLNLVVERDKEPEIFRSLRSVSRDRIYSLDSSVVHGPPSPASKSSPQKRLRFSDAVVKDKESFASVFASRYNRGPAEDVQTMQMHESGNFAGNKSDAASAGSVAKVDDEEFVIEDEESINMSFSLLKKKSFFENSKEARSAASSSTHGNKNLQAKASEVISGQSPISQRKRSSQTTRNEKGSNVKKGTTDERKYILSEKTEETKLTPSSATYGSQTTAKFKAMLAQSLPYSRTMQQTRQTNKEFEMAKEVNLDLISDTNPERMYIPRNPKSKVEGSKSSSVLHQMEVETEPTETFYEQSTGQSQAVGNTLKDAKTNKTKDSLCTDKNSFASRLVRIANIEPPKTRIDITDLPVVDEDEFVVHDHADFENDPASCRKKTVKIPNDSKNNKKRETNVACEVLNTTYISARKGDNATDSRKSHNDGRDSSSPLTEMAEEEDLDMIWNTDCERIKILRNPKSKVERSKSPSVSHQMEVEIEPTETVSKQSTMQSPTVGKTLKDDKTKKTKDSLCTDKSFASHLVRIANIEPRVTTRINITDLPEVDEDEFVIHNYTDFENDPKSCKKKTVKIPNDRKKNTKGEKNVACEVLNATYTNARKSDNNATDSRNSHNDGRDSSSQLTDKKGKKSRRTELDKLVLQKYLQADFDKQSESISLRPKRASAPRIPWWVVNQAERNSASDGEEYLLQSPKSKRKVSADLKEPLESLMDKEENFEMKESRPLDKNEEKTLKESDAKSPKTVNSRKRTKKTKHVEREEMPGPSGVKRLKNNNCKRKPRTTRRKQKASTKLQEQLEQETQERDTEGPQENDLNVPDLSNKADHFSRAATPESPTMDEPQGLPPQKHKPVLDEPYEKSPASGSRIQHQSVNTCKCTEEREPHPPHYGLPQQSHASPAYDSARLTFQSGPVLKTRAVRYNIPMNTVVRNLSTAESLNVDMSPFTIVLDPDTNSEAISDCIHRTNRVRQSNPSLVWRCFNNTVFSAGKMVLKPTEEDVRDAPQYDILVFYIVRGIIKLKLHKSLHTLERGDFFYIPPCNTYHMKNQGREDVELIFTQLKTRST